MAAQLIVHGGVVPELGLDSGANATEVAGRPSAVAMSDGRITAIGGDELLQLADGSTRIIDAQGGAILPGINDGHLHFAASAMTRYAHLQLKDAQSWQEVVDRIEAASPDPGGWVRAAGWDEAVLGTDGSENLATARPDTPAVAFDASGHQVMVNGEALRRLDLGEKVPDVPGGVVGRNHDGSVNGRFADAAMRLVNDSLPPFAEDQLRQAFLRFQDELHMLGVTSLTDPGLGPGGRTLMAASCDTPSLQILTELARDGLLSLRVNCLLLFAGTGGESVQSVREGLESALPALAEDVDPLRLRIAGVKVFADGIPRSGTAWFHDEYQLPCGHGHGALVLEGTSDEDRVDQFRAILAHIDAAGLQAGVHATGDAATEAFIEAVEALPDPRGVKNNRHYVIHGAFADNSVLQRMARAGIGYSTNPSIRSEAGALMQKLLGQQRFEAQQPLATAAERGVGVSLASDSPVTSPDWRQSVIAAVTRNTSAGPGDGEPERLTQAQALAMMTQTPAWQDHAEQDKGWIREGYLADLCILRDPLSARVEELLNNPTSYTIVGGNVVYERG